MADIANVIGDLLAAAGVGVVVGAGVNIFNGRMNDKPDNAMAIRPMPGSAPIRAMGPSLTAPVRERPDVQILVRNLKYQDLATKVDQIKAALDRFVGTIGGKQYYIELAYEPMYMGIDENQRHQTSIVFNVVRER